MSQIPEKSKVSAAKVNQDLPNELTIPVERQLTEPYLQIENVNKVFGEFVALKDIYLNVYPGEFVCLLGPSGCGKTTLLRIICGLETQTSGRIMQGGKDVSQLPPQKRDFGIVFQSYALFPNLTAEQNIAYGLENAKKPKAEIRQRVTELLELVGLEGLGKKYPSQMSGGQQQRVALARALALSPGLLLLDEPLSALDAKVRDKLRGEITKVQRRLGITTVMVTHDQSEALAMADRVVVMDKGYIAQVGTANSIYQYPQSPFVANFIGVMNFLEGVIIAEKQIRCGNLTFNVPQNQLSVNQRAKLAIRPEDIQVVFEQTNNKTENTLTAQVEDIEFLGSVYRLTLNPEGDAKESLIVEINTHQARQLDLNNLQSLNIYFPPEQVKVF
ncbi:MAG: putative 2-aminoethylphosphonate ABC transporter ATP-binding protein [Gomphosphaeria aponina SAG 52.96 = DSM 107014]|uniref:ABC-type quaternary amine transporter n=1 Tax=Gomphosphaeria aponina SAG 52.96 = DSM 107014 TaxID=1521640 RepID=A0A941GQS4_9CHRO|nr:putative 2-aminoethylphosphonate ABC transporter ATP-binding protein [Gomphosphaeria aponina SAG 52.96 = DSM 107014]